MKSNMVDILIKLGAAVATVYVAYLFVNSPANCVWQPGEEGTECVRRADQQFRNDIISNARRK